MGHLNGFNQQLDMLQIGTWTVDPASRRACSGNRAVRLSPKAMAVLNALCRAQGGLVSRDQLMASVWPDVVVGEEVITHAIAELRKGFGDDPRTPYLIETVYKSGYRLLVPVTGQSEVTEPGDLNPAPTHTPGLANGSWPFNEPLEPSATNAPRPSHSLTSARCI